MDDKNNLFTIKSKNQKIESDKDCMKSKLKIIEVKHSHWEYDHSDYGSDNSWQEYQTVGYFDNIDDAWNLVQERVEKFHTRMIDYTFTIVEINAKSETINGTTSEEEGLIKYNQEQIRLEKEELDSRTLGFRCEECKLLIKMCGGIENKKSSHGQEQHQDDLHSWGWVTWTRIMKKEVIDTE